MCIRDSIKSTHSIAEITDFEAKIGAILREEGPVFADFLVEQGPLGPRSYTEMYRPERRKAFREALGAKN